MALAGFGTVGQSVARLLQQTPEDVELVAILNRRVAAKRVDWLDAGVRWTESIDELLEADVDVFVELIGGRDPAETWMRRALDRGISVVTANKQVIAHEGPALRALAAARGCQLRFEGSVAGGVPVIRAIESGLASDTLTQVAGILNGTCNYILTRMEQDGAGFDTALEGGAGARLRRGRSVAGHRRRRRARETGDSRAGGLRHPGAGRRRSRPARSRA